MKNCPFQVRYTNSAFVSSFRDMGKLRKYVAFERHFDNRTGKTSDFYRREGHRQKCSDAAIDIICAFAEEECMLALSTTKFDGS